MVEKVSREELNTRMDRNHDFVLIDTLPETAYRRGHLPCAVGIVSEALSTSCPVRIPDRNAEIVVYCGNGPCKRSSLSAERLIGLGYTHVRHYHEGKADWIAADLPIEAG